MDRLARSVAAAVLTLAWTVPAAAQRSLVIQDFSADISVNVDGSIDVVETIQPRFTGRWNGIYRKIPVEYRTPQGFNYTLRLDSVAVTDQAGRPLKYESSRERHYRKFKIWVPGAADATRTVVLHYTVHNALRFFDEHDELYWNVTGDEWEVPIETARARIHLPAGVAGLRAAAFTGGYGSQAAAAQVNLGPSEIDVHTLQSLNFKEGLTAVVGWYPGVVRRPTTADRAAGFVRGNMLLLVPVLVLGIMWRLWYKRGRDPRLRPIAAAYEPPENLAPGELGTLVDNRADMRDITATLVDLAVRGFVLIEEQDHSHLFGLVSGKEYVFHLRKPRSEWTALKPHEQWLLEALFKHGSSGTGALDNLTLSKVMQTGLKGLPDLAKRLAAQAAKDSSSESPVATDSNPPATGASAAESVTLSQLENSFYKDLPELKQRLFNQLIERGYYVRRPDRVKAAYISVGFVAGIAIGVGGSFLSVAFGIEPLAAIIAGILSALIIVGFGLIMPARTEKGVRALEGVLGFEEFLRRVEGDRLDRVVKTPEMFEKYLPFAMALAVERTWARAFEGICKEPPTWYQGAPAGVFYPHVFVGSLNGLSTRTAGAMASAPRSSGGSGFGGGGFSGGGFGGGGGGGF
jgi:hypothetical protein